MTSAVQRSAVIAIAIACACTLAREALHAQPARDSPYLLLFAGDQDNADSDFIAVIDLQPGSETFGKAIATTPIGMTSRCRTTWSISCRRPASSCS